MQHGDPRAAHQHCLAILKLDPTFADAWFLCGIIAAGNGLVEKSVEILVRAVGLARAAGNDNAEYRVELGKQLLASNEFERALTEANAARALQPQSPAVLNTLGTLLSQLGDHENARTCFTAAAESIERFGTSQTSQWQASLYFNLGASLQFSGEFDAAAAAYEKAIHIEPNSFRAHWALSSLERYNPLDNHLERLQGLLEEIKTPRDQLHLGHAIAKELEDLEDYANSAKYLAWAKNATIRAGGYDAHEPIELMRQLEAAFDRSVCEQGGGITAQSPVFIVGMPRTGTTLVEQILGSHSQVHAGGELPYIPATVRELSEVETPLGLAPDFLPAAIAVDPGVLGQRYLDHVRARIGTTQRFTDKLPLNFLFIGLIHRALPDAKFVCLRRDPMDTCLSNYRQMFAANFQHYHYNLDLLDCGRYYVAFNSLMEHWRNVLPGTVFELEYEGLVTSSEQQVRALLEHCDLPWEEACLSFHTRKASVATPSAVQVRQGIYTDSVDRWKRYGDTVQPLYELLQSAGFYDS